MTSQKLIQLLVQPSKIATALDWKKVSGSVLTLDIHKDRIGMALASHPAFQGNARTLESVKLLPKGEIPKEAKAKMSRIVSDNKVCGVVVSWPVQQDTGRMGAACGRVIHTLEDLVKYAASSNIKKMLPVCLWDGVHPQQEREDKWGRCSVYSRTSDKHIHRASVEQYNQDENIVSAQVWDDFVRTHWPTIYEHNAVYSEGTF